MPANAIEEMPTSAASGAGDAPAILDEVLAHNGSSEVRSEWIRSFSDEVVISGMSCRLPESDNVNEFMENLFNGVDMVTEDSRRWTPGAHGLPKRQAKLKDLTRFDSTFFGIHAKQADRMDPQLRMLLEVTYEAIIDAGVDPSNLRGSKTGVFIGASASEASDSWSADVESTSGFTMIGCQRGMFSNRLSYFFDFKGPSFTMDTACSSSLLALDQALLAIRTSQCDQAIVGGSSLCIKPATAVQFNNLSMLSVDGACKSFDESGNGYARSEAVVAILLQKSQTSKRVYAKLIHSKNNSDGNKEGGKSITFPSGRAQQTLMTEVYEECCVPPSKITYVEAHGTGTAAGDPTECNAISNTFCKGRTEPLPIGSVKSNMGHPEPASGLAALTKLLISSEKQMIPANLHFKKANPEIEGLQDGRLKVVSENTSWEGGLCAINSFGFGGTNVHTLLETNSMIKPQNQGADSVSRLFTYCGRTEDSLADLLNIVKTEYGKNSELLTLLSETSNQSSKLQPYRGHVVVNGNDTQPIVQKCEYVENRSIWYVFSGMGSQWFGMAKSLLQLPLFSQSIRKCSKYLEVYGLNLLGLLTSTDEAAFRSVIHSFVSIAAIQVGLVDLLAAMGLKPDGIIGHSVGELGCGYADGSLTAREAVLAAYWRGRCISEADLEPGAMAAVGLTWKETCARCPTGVVAACHNSVDTVTVSGPKKAVSDFVAQLKSEGVFAKEVSSNGVAFHSYYMSAIAPKLKSALEKIIDPKRRTSRWISSSIPEKLWGSNLHLFSSADYHVNNLVSPVLFQEALSRVPENAAVIEIAPHALLQAILKRSLSATCVNVPLQKRNDADNLMFFYDNISRLYESGISMNVSNLYGEVEFPVSRGTPSLSSLVRWDHAASYDVPNQDDFNASSLSAGLFSININHEEDETQRRMSGHVIDGRVILPATGYLVMVWKTLAKKLQRDYKELPVVFQDVNIHNATILPNDGEIVLSVNLLETNGDFEVMCGDKLAVSGKIFTPESGSSALLDVSELIDLQTQPELLLNSDDVYKELRLRGYEYRPTYQGILSATLNGESGVIRWEDDWNSYLDTLLQLTILSSRDRTLRLPTRIKSVHIDPTILYNEERLDSVRADYDSDLKLISTLGVQIFAVHTTSTTKRRDKAYDAILETYQFIPEHSEVKAATPDFQEYLDCCAFVTYSSLKSVNENAHALRLPNKFLKDLSQLSDKDMNEDLLNMFSTDNNKYSFINYLQKLSADCQNESYNFSDDLLLSNLLKDYHLKSALDIVLENTSYTSGKLKICEFNSSQFHIYKRILKLYNQQPLVRVEMTVCDDRDDWDCESENVSKRVCSLMSSDKPTNQNLVVGHSLMIHLTEILTCVKSGGFILSLEYNSELDCEKLSSLGLEVVFSISDGLQSLYLLKQKPKQVNIDYVMVDGFTPYWVEPLQEKISQLENSDENSRLWIIASKANGAVGLVNCLRLESAGDRIRCIFNTGSKPLPEITSEEIKSVMSRDLVMNVYKDGVWGSYRHLPLYTGNADDLMYKPTKYSYVNVLPTGTSGFSNLKWIEAPLTHETVPENSQLCQISYSALNFRDIMLASGKLSADAIPGHDKMRGCLLGMEFSGQTQDGKTVMGLCSAKALATSVIANKDYLWDVPKDWSLHDACTVPVVYATAYYALIIRGRLKPGESVLIHSGSGGVGQAAISIALDMNCQVFTTVGNEEKKKYLLNRFPDLKPDHILNSRSTQFEHIIMKMTKSKGVNVILNSLAEEKLQASVRVLSKHARFLEIGKFDLSNDHQLGMAMFLKNVSFHGILLDSLFPESNEENEGENNAADWQTVHSLVSEGIKTGVVRPLNSTIYNYDEMESAFRFMSSGKHVGKVLIKMPNSGIKINSVTRSYCNPNKSYLLCGGLGGFGLELADWLIERGAKYLILTSRSGITTGYQSICVNKWRQLGVTVIISKKNAANYSEAHDLIEECVSVKPLGAIFNLAMVLRDGMLENLTESEFKKVFEPKISATQNLDSLTREQEHRTALEQFVCFSSISGGRGNTGQSNYGFANTAMERICESRHSNGLPGLAIQWGAIGDVGVVATHMQGESVGGTIPQRITSCLESLDIFMCQNNSAVVSSFVCADKEEKTAAKQDDDIVSSVLKILGVKDSNSISHDSTLGELGLDSIMSVEVKQTLERGFNIQLSMKQIRTLTVKSLKQLQSAPESEQGNAIPSTAVKEEVKSVDVKITQPQTLMPEVTLKTMRTGSEANPPIFMVHPIEGHVDNLMRLANQLDGYNVYGLQCTSDVPVGSIKEMADFYIQIIQQRMQGKIILVGYSFGACVAIEMALAIAQQLPNVELQLVLIDGSQDYVRHVTKQYDSLTTDQQRQNEAFISYLQHLYSIINKPADDLKEGSSLMKYLNETDDLTSRLNYISESLADFDKICLHNALLSYFNKLSAAHQYKPSGVLDLNMLLIKADSGFTGNELDPTYNLSQVCRQMVTVETVTGNHKTMLNGPTVCDVIMKHITNVVSEE